VIHIYFAGIDLGSTMTKVVIIDGNDKILSRVIDHTGAEHRRLANKVMDQALERSGLSFNEISFVVATGYGRIIVPFADRQITELSCHARGIFHFFPDVRLAIDIGGQDAKGLKINHGKLKDFIMSDKCAAGTGRFLDVIAKVLGVRTEDLGTISLKSTKKVSISSLCTVFAQHEVVSRLSEGASLEDIVAGIHDAIAIRTAKMAGRLKTESDVFFTGGVAKNIGVVKALEENLGCKVFVPEEPLLTGALGAALLGKEITSKAMKKGEPLQTVGRRLTEASFFD
jgi:(R)-2-hydroxyacyl-CoA dehydratese activating ATPase